MVAALAMAVGAAEAGALEQTRPNIVVIFVDDLGYADLGAQGQVDDVRTPHLDRLASEGVRCTAGYVTAPQCSPSRAGLITGRYQQRFGLDTIPDCPMPLEELTIAERLKPAGYKSGMVGKWHLEPNALSRAWAESHQVSGAGGRRGRFEIPPDQALAYYPHRQGFDEYFVGTTQRYYTNVAGADDTPAPEGSWHVDGRFRIDVQSDAAVAFVRRNHSRPFFLYLCYYAPHVPLESTEEYLGRFPESMATRRRYALSMMAAVDDGVGRLLDVLRETGQDENTLVVFTSDNGAPLKMTKEDLPIEDRSGAWDGSLNTPWVGEKGMLSEGGIRVPFLLRWKNRLPAGLVYREPVSTLDIAATAVALAGLPHDERLDGVDLVPFLTGERAGPPHRLLFWRFWSQAAVRAGRWKYLTAGPAEFLFDLESDAHETHNLLAEQPDVGERLRTQLQQWTRELQPPGIPRGPLNVQEQAWYAFYFGLPTGAR